MVSGRRVPSSEQPFGLVHERAQDVGSRLETGQRADRLPGPGGAHDGTLPIARSDRSEQVAALVVREALLCCVAAVTTGVDCATTELRQRGTRCEAKR